MKTVLLAVNCYLITLFACLAAGPMVPPPKAEPAPLGISVETLGAVRLGNGADDAQWGTGFGAAVSVNRFVDVTSRILAYKTPDNWGGSTVDEINIGASARLLHSANDKLSLSAVGAINYAFDVSDFGLSLGARVKWVLYEGIYAFGQAEWQVWDRDEQPTRHACSTVTTEALSSQGALVTFGFGRTF